MKTPWAVILCKFTDENSEPFPKQHYDHLFTTAGGGSAWNMPRYFADYSHGKLDLSGTKVLGWYQLKKSVADYNALGGAARAALIQWARDAATANGVDLSPFFNVVVCTNLWHDIGAAPGAGGVVAQGPTTQIPSLLAHEMGHVYGLPHSRIDGSVTDYQDPWDIMSAAATFTAPDPEFSQIGPGVNAWNMRSRGWLDESRVWKAGDGGVDETIVLRPLAARELSGYLAAEIPGGYLVEFRVRSGWDGGIPRPAVLIHRTDGSASYIMRGNAGSADLVAGDSFGDDEPVVPDVLDLFSEFQRLDVVSIDPAGQQATLRFRHRLPVDLERRAVDPMSLVLSTKAYLIWLEIHEPHTPRVADIQTALREMTPVEQRAALARARALSEYGRAAEEAILGLGATSAPRVGEKLLVQGAAKLAGLVSRPKAG
jgi:hypothetical protein